MVALYDSRVRPFNLHAVLPTISVRLSLILYVLVDTVCTSGVPGTCFAPVILFYCIYYTLAGNLERASFLGQAKKGLRV